MILSIVLLLIVFYVIIKLLTSFVIVQQNTIGLVSKLGKYSHELKPGFHFITPFIEKVKIVNLKSTPLALQSYQVITKDNAEVTIDLTLNYIVSDAVKFLFANSDSVQSMEYQVRGVVRDIIGTMDLDEVLSSTNIINKQIMENIGDLTDQYGVRIERLQVDQITAPEDVQRAMNLQISASKNKQATIIDANAASAKLEIDTKAQNEAQLLNAETQQKQTKIEADANKYQVETAAEADANRIKKINDALSSVGEGYFKNQSISAFAKAGEHNNLIIAPSSSASDFGQVASILKTSDKLNSKK